MVTAADFWAMQRALTPGQVDHLVGLGVAAPVIATTVGFTKVEVFAAGCWQPFQDGLPAYILPCGWRQIVPPTRLRSVLDPIPFDQVVDLVAVFPSAPATWALRQGYGTFLGEDAVEAAGFDRTALTLYETPLEWLQNEAMGACIVNWSAFNPFVDLARVPEVICSTPELRRRLDALITDLSRPPFQISGIAA